MGLGEPPGQGAERTDPVDFSGKTDAGDAVSSADFAGKVLVVNFWYAACGPCRAEAPDLDKAYAETKGSDVAFLGINTSDSPQAENTASNWAVAVTPSTS